MAEDRQAEGRTYRRGWRRVATAFVICAALVVLFHRPILLAIGLVAFAIGARRFQTTLA